VTCRCENSISSRWRPLRVRIKYFASAREIAGLREETLEIEDSATVMDLLRALVNKHGDALKEYVFDPKTKDPRTHLQFLLNGRAIHMLQGFDTSLTNDCTLSIMPPVAGG